METKTKHVCSSGFTLFELLVVMMLIGIMAGFVMPRIGGNPDRLRFITAVKDVAALMRYARSQAVTQGREYQVVYETPLNQMVVVPSDAAYSYPSENEPIANDRIKRVYGLPDGVAPELSTFDDREDTVVLATFFSMGNSSGTRLTLTGKSNLRKDIDTDLITGAVRIVEP